MIKSIAATVLSVALLSSCTHSAGDSTQSSSTEVVSKASDLESGLSSELGKVPFEVVEVHTEYNPDKYITYKIYLIKVGKKYYMYSMSHWGGYHTTMTPLDLDEDLNLSKLVEQDSLSRK